MATGDRALRSRARRFKVQARAALHDLFDQSSPFGRLSLVQTLMLSGDTLVTISLAGSLFITVSPHEAKSKVFFYLVLTLAPFAVVSPLLGPLIDRSRNARRAMVVASAVGRAVLCPLMARDIHSLLLYPEAFCILVLSKLYNVTRGALVPEMAAITVLDEEQRDDRPTAEAAPGEPPAEGGKDSAPRRRPAKRPLPTEFAVLNARLTLLGTAAGFIASAPGILLLNVAGPQGVLWFAAFVFVGGAVAGARLPVLRRGATRAAPKRARATVPDDRGSGTDPPPKGRDAADWGPAGRDRDLATLQPVAHPEVLLGLTTMSLIRGLAGFLLFLLAFGLKAVHAPVWWYGLALSFSGIGALVGLVLVPRLRERLREQQILVLSIFLIAVTAAAVSFWHVLFAQVLLAFVVGVAGSMAQPSFDAMAQRYVRPEEQGRAFAKFATRQQLTWVVAAMIPVLVLFPLSDGDVVMAAVAAAGGLFYVTSRRALRGRAMIRQHRDPE